MEYVRTLEIVDYHFSFLFHSISEITNLVIISSDQYLQINRKYGRVTYRDEGTYLNSHYITLLPLQDNVHVITPLATLPSKIFLNPDYLLTDHLLNEWYLQVENAVNCLVLWNFLPIICFYSISIIKLPHMNLLNY